MQCLYIKLHQEMGILGLCLRTVFKVEALSWKLRDLKLESDPLIIIEENLNWTSLPL